MTSLLEEGLKIVLAEPASSIRDRVRLPISIAAGGALPGVELNRSASLEELMGDR